MAAFNLGLIDGDFLDGSHIDAIEDEINKNCPAGTVTAFVGSSAPDGWLLLNGQTVTGADASYPVLWSRVPTSWKSGSSLVLPDAGTRVIGGYKGGSPNHSTLGGTTGAASVSLTEANMPAHTHTAGTLATSSSGTHAHDAFLGGPATTVVPAAGSGIVGTSNNQTTDPAGAHTQTISGSTGSKGSGEFFSIVPSTLVLN